MTVCDTCTDGARLPTHTELEAHPGCLYDGPPRPLHSRSAGDDSAMALASCAISAQIVLTKPARKRPPASPPGAEAHSKALPNRTPSQ